MNTQCPLRVSLADNRLLIDVSSDRLRNGRINYEDALAFTNEFLDKLNTKCNFELVCSPNCSNSCLLCVESIIGLAKDAT